MDNFKIIYRILKAMDKSIDSGDVRLPIHTELEITLDRYYALLIAMVDEGLIDGVSYNYYLEQSEPDILLNKPRLTLKGFEYLAENSTINKAKSLVKGMIDIGTKL
ncbi:MAG TPA: YjcQ family protein [Clostridia bacterium]|nr:YjcQ family protein [Clostridia bacterium]